MTVTCCYKCPRRTATCHFDGSCKEYPEQAEATRAENEARYKNGSVNGYLREQATRIKRRNLYHKGFTRKTRRK